MGKKLKVKIAKLHITTENDDTLEIDLPITVEPTPEPEPVSTYTVIAGDTLILIGEKLGVVWQDIAVLNNIVEPYLITVGQVLKVPKKPETNKKYVLLNGINWQPEGDPNPILTPGANLHFDSASEFTYFILPVSSNGQLLGGSTQFESKFISDVKAGGKKATFSVGGGSQNKADIASAITTHRDSFITNIETHVREMGYDGVTLDIENTDLAPQAVVDFINALRLRLDSIKPGLIIGCYTQPYQKETVWKTLDQAANALTWISPMVYDFPNSVADLKRITLEWLPKVKGDKSKLLVGAAVNYDATGLNQTEFSEVLEWINTEGIAGIGLWNNVLYTKEYRDILKSKLKNIA